MEKGESLAKTRQRQLRLVKNKATACRKAGRRLVGNLKKREKL